MLKLGLETESLHLWLQHKRMDIFGFIEKAHELGLDGVQINIIKDYNLTKDYIIPQALLANSMRNILEYFFP